MDVTNRHFYQDMGQLSQQWISKAFSGFTYAIISVLVKRDMSQHSLPRPACDSFLQPANSNFLLYRTKDAASRWHSSLLPCDAVSMDFEASWCLQLPGQADLSPLSAWPWHSITSQKAWTFSNIATRTSKQISSQTSCLSVKEGQALVHVLHFVNPHLSVVRFAKFLTRDDLQ